MPQNDPWAVVSVNNNQPTQPIQPTQPTQPTPAAGATNPPANSGASDPWAVTSVSGKPAAQPTSAPTPAAPTMQPIATISAAHEPTTFLGKFGRWAENVANDIKYGTDETGIGTVLKKMGAHGVYTGNPEAVGDFMASLPLGLLRATKGTTELAPAVIGGAKGRTWEGLKDIVGGGLQAAQIPGAFVAPEAGEAGAKAAASASERVGSALEEAATKTRKIIHGGQPELQSAVREAGASAIPEITRVHPPEIDPAVKDPALLRPFSPEEIKIKEFPAAGEGENPTARITGPNGSSIELELNGKIAKVKSIVNSGKPGDGQRLYDNAIEWAKDAGFDSLEGDDTQTQAAKTAWQRIAERHVARMSDKGVPSIDLSASRPTAEAASEIQKPVRTVIEDASNTIKAKSQGIYRQLDEASGGRWQRYEDQIKNLEDKMDEVNGIDDEAYGRLETKRNDIETSQAQMLEDLKAKGVDPKIADDAVAHYKQAMALKDLDRAVKGATSGDIRVGEKEVINPKMFVNRIQKLYDTGRLEQALGKDASQTLLKQAYAAKTAQAQQQLLKNIAWWVGKGALIAAGAGGATEIVKHVL